MRKRRVTLHFALPVCGLGILASSLALSVQVVQGQSLAAFDNREFVQEVPLPPPSYTPPEPPPVVQPTPPPTPPPAPPPPTQVFVPPPPPRPFIPILVPTDVTGPALYPYQWGKCIEPTVVEKGLAYEREFPRPEDCNGDANNILVRARDNETVYKKINPFTVRLENGAVLVGIKRPSRVGIVESVIGKVALYSDGDVLVESKGDVLRVTNLDGMGRNCRVNLTDHHFSGWKQHIFSLKPGYELVASNHALQPLERRPLDGVMRRQTRLVEDNHLAISQFHVESMIARCGLLADLSRSNKGTIERRMLADMSKMAAVLNSLEGYNGFQTDAPAPARMAAAPGSTTN